jgi:serine protease
VSRVAPLLAVLAAALSGSMLLQPGSSADADVLAHAAAERVPNDTGLSRVAGGWAQLQWNFAGSHGVNAPAAWANLERAGAPGATGVTIAVLDTGVAYADRGMFRRSPDLDPMTFVPGYDFVDDDPYPFDLNGHGTHVASTIAEQTNNGFGLTGLAYGARIMPVRVLDRRGWGNGSTVARGVRFATEHGAKIINLSLNFGSSVTPDQIRDLLDAIDEAHAHGSLVVGAAGNEGLGRVAYPARAEHVVAVGATTDGGCLSSFSNRGSALDLVAPGGGTDAALRDDPACSPGRRSRPIFQITTATRRVDRFVISGRFAGTSMATPHVSATAALIVASGVLGTNPGPDTIERRVEQTARDLGAPGFDARYGWGLVDAGAATTPVTTSARVSGGSIRRGSVASVSYAGKPSRR